MWNNVPDLSKALHESGPKLKKNYDQQSDVVPKNLMGSKQRSEAGSEKKCPEFFEKRIKFDFLKKKAWMGEFSDFWHERTKSYLATKATKATKIVETKRLKRDSLFFIQLFR